MRLILILLKQYRTRRTQLYEQSKYDEDDGENGQQEDAGNEQVECAFDDTVADRSERFVVQAENRCPVHQAE